MNKGMDIPDGWWAIAESSEVGTKPLGIERFGIDLVLWRKGSALVVMSDTCPHRSAKLSLGEIKGDKIICPFHGFEFDSCGSCTFVPETKQSAVNLKAPTFVAIERGGMIFVRLGETAEPAPPWFEELEGNYSYRTMTDVWDTHVTRSVENQLDYAHLPFVHRNTIGGGTDPSRPVTFELTDQGIKMFTDAHKDTKTFFHLKFNNIWMLSILPGRLCQFLAFVPVNDKQTKLYLRAYQTFCTIPLLSDLVNLIMMQQNRYILNQDKHVVLSQKPLCVLDADDEKLYPSDKGIAHFREYWRTSLEAKAKGQQTATSNC